MSLLSVSSSASSSTSPFDAPPPPEPPPPAGRARKTCDACVVRKVRCVRERNTEDCSECRRHGVRCTTTLHVRKKHVARSGEAVRRINYARAVFGSTAPEHDGDVVAASQSTTKPSLSFLSLEGQLAQLQLEGGLVVELVQEFTALPQARSRLVPTTRLISDFENAGRRLSALPDSMQVLLLSVMSLSAHSSRHPHLFEFGAPTVSPQTLGPLTNTFDLRAFGHRRASMCARLRAQATQLAWKSGTLATPSEENLASCYLLESLMARTDSRSSSAYGSAFVSHVRTTLSEPQGRRLLLPETPDTWDRRPPWMFLILLEAISCLMAGQINSFSEADLDRLCLEEGDMMGVLVAHLDESIKTRDRGLLAGLGGGGNAAFKMASYLVKEMIRLANFSVDRLTGLAVLHRPISPLDLDFFLATHANIAAALHLVASLVEYIASLIPSPTAFPALPDPFVSEPDRFIIVIHLLRLNFATLALPLHQRGDAGPAVRALAEQGTLLASLCVSNAPSLEMLTHLLPLEMPMRGWVQVAIEADSWEFETRRSVLEALLQGIKTVGWSWAGPEDGRNWTWELAALIENELRMPEYEELD